MGTVMGEEFDNVWEIIAVLNKVKGNVDERGHIPLAALLQELLECAAEAQLFQKGKR